MITDLLEHLNKMYKEKNYEQILEKCKKAKPKDDFEYCRINWFKAITLLDLERFEEAAKVFESLIDREPDDPFSYDDLARCLGKMGKNVQAFENFDKAISLNPNETLFYYNKGSLLNEIGLHEEALNYYNAGLAINPTLVHLLIGKSHALARLGLGEESLNEIEKVLKIDPNQEVRELRDSMKNDLRKKYPKLLD